MPDTRAKTASPKTGSTSAQILCMVTNTDADVKDLVIIVKQLSEQITKLEEKVDNSLVSPSNPIPINNMTNTLDDKVIELHNIVLSDKVDREIQSRCKTLKDRISMYWSRNLSLRKKSWWQYLQNSSKAELYTDWIADHPLYIPFKFKPKSIRGETNTATQVRIGTARTKYHNEIDLLKSYAGSHEQKYKDIDDEVIRYINNLTSNTEETKILEQWWRNDTKRCEDFSRQLWAKKEDFLNTKKSEDLDAGNVEFKKLLYSDAARNDDNFDNRRGNDRRNPKYNDAHTRDNYRNQSPPYRSNNNRERQNYNNPNKRYSNTNNRVNDRGYYNQRRNPVWHNRSNSPTPNVFDQRANSNWNSDTPYARDNNNYDGTYMSNYRQPTQSLNWDNRYPINDAGNFRPAIPNWLQM